MGRAVGVEGRPGKPAGGPSHRQDYQVALLCQLHRLGDAGIVGPAHRAAQGVGDLLPQKGLQALQQGDSRPFRLLGGVVPQLVVQLVGVRPNQGDFLPLGLQGEQPLVFQQHRPLAGPAPGSGDSPQP